MCTVTVVSLGRAPQDCAGRAFRLACNRDELRTRPLANPPSEHRAGSLRAVWPVDPVGGGTWIGANERGVVLSLLNRNIDDSALSPRDANHQSRGTIIPAALAFDTIDPIVRFLTRDFDPRRYPRFRLIGVDGVQSLMCESDGASITTETTPLGPAPLFLTSSGLGDALVERPRRSLFEEWFLQPTTTAQAEACGSASPQMQDDFHRHSWPDRTHLSVCMRRDAARTVSFSAITVTPVSVEFHYHAGPPDEPAAQTRVDLPRRHSD